MGECPTLFATHFFLTDAGCEAHLRSRRPHVSVLWAGFFFQECQDAVRTAQQSVAGLQSQVSREEAVLSAVSLAGSSEKTVARCLGGASCLYLVQHTEHGRVGLHLADRRSLRLLPFSGGWWKLRTKLPLLSQSSQPAETSGSRVTAADRRGRRLFGCLLYVPL